MRKSLTIVTEDGSVSIYSVCKLVYLLILSALCLVAALAINETIQKILEKYVKKEGIWGYVIYSIIAILLIIIVAYVGCRCSPEIIEYIDLSPM
jgi:uncharacterized membrane protein YdjX (TVP38/TMEM64 family)